MDEHQPFIIDKVIHFVPYNDDFTTIIMWTKEEDLEHSFILTSTLMQEEVLGYFSSSL
jgi:hypothetical protein